MPLRDLCLPNWLDTSTGDLIADFFAPALKHADRYDRGVGYFSSGWLRLAASGMADFAARGGHARWVTSPILDENDWHAMLTGHDARRDATLRDALARTIDDLTARLERDTLNALAWMIADGVITFKLAVPRHKLDAGDFHDKFGVFTDARGDRISFNGSYNDSVQGNRNYESIKIFPSWHDAFRPLCDADADRFDRLWRNADPNVAVYDLPRAAHERILHLRTADRPYRPPPRAHRPRQPDVPRDVTLRDYQHQAIQAWLPGTRGFFEMATGTGKTITALAASTALIAREGRLAVVIAVPYQHLVDQWADDARRFGYAPILAFDNRHRWMGPLHDRLRALARGDTDHACVIVTHATLSTDAFQQALREVTGQLLVIADEAHHLGTPAHLAALPAHAGHRLALSATPNRWFDDAGTAALRAYFGDTIFALPLADAIGTSLTPYTYHPVLVELTDEETDAYADLSVQITRLHAAAATDSDAADRLRRLLLRRADLLNRAENKLPALSDVLRVHPVASHALFYCAPGQLDDVVHQLGFQHHLRVHRFTATERPAERRRLLEHFDRGDLQALAAIRCLDEGVDVPNTRTAFLLASSSNPREFIQRRGRVLRRAPGKTHAVIHDFITIPPLLPGVVSSTERSVVRRELARFTEFAQTAQNTHDAYAALWDVLQRHTHLDAQEHA
ncbi:DEAD/DEAH box helicase family protein [Deinococcus yavapaiensis]|uniref:Superfamily II DNA or RNA helicase n=1 Tax=Deinococcus yavapaiensis KR-236 TaxID=694435 RepID=A0A318SCF5_9DEIO|nr:DEAD/DEAH box helicase family protein [Deinococcus yavapaiensis]PYE54098.1 superfamily II DNA or RNA helicase [Deinococcus yavapaiensis KR-236]